MNQEGNGPLIDPLAHDPAKPPIWKVYSLGMGVKNSRNTCLMAVMNRVISGSYVLGIYDSKVCNYVFLFVSLGQRILSVGDVRL